MIIVILFLIRSSYAGDGRYECGPNGRFEYCIDDSPGCVVGCHCYPGYFFDTDTKICEPNTKLTHDFRRHYVIDPGKYATITEPAPATTAPAPDASKDNDDLSDWLYNQFFKTIENQVINKTDDDDDLTKKETRRSGGGSVLTRRFKKKRSRKGSKKSKKGLRRKLLRISEDDSIFDSESDYDSSSSSSSWENWSTGDSDTKPDKQKPKPHDHDGDHRKIVVFSKKPKPPLPSFIFLPNIETPFYPPIGLPIPPLPAPMYPMVPIPPIQPPPQGGNTPGSTAGSTDGASTPTSAQTTTEKPKTDPPGALDSKTDAPPPPNIDDPNTNESNTDEPNTNVPTTDKPTTDDTSTDDTNNEDTNIEDTNTDDTHTDDTNTDDTHTDDTNTDDTNTNEPNGDEPTTENTLRGGRSKVSRGRARNQLLNRLKKRNKSQRLKAASNQRKKKGAPRQLLRTPRIKPFPKQFQNPSFGAGNAVQQPILEDNEVPPFNNEVDFNYLSQLIHRVDLNGTTPASPRMKFNDNRNKLIEFMNSGPMSLPPGLRRAPAGPRRSLSVPASALQPDDSYYTKLGREIAKLIRDVHPYVDAGDEVYQGRDKASPFLGDDTFRSRSYWERFVRSPMKLRLGNLSKIGNLKSSNEKLFDLENKAEVAAESSSVLSLPELENVINAMRKAENQIQKRTSIRQSRENNKKPSNSSLNISLLSPHKGKLINTAKKTPSKSITTQIGNKRSLTTNQDFRRNNLTPSNTSNVPTSGKKQVNHAIKKYLPNQHILTQNYNSKYGNNLQFTTSAPNIVYNIKNTNQLQPAIIHSNYLNHYYNTYSKLIPYFSTTEKEPYRPYIESKPSYFFNDFDFFI